MHCTGCGELLPAMAARCPKCGKMARTMARATAPEADGWEPIEGVMMPPRAPGNFPVFRSVFVGCLIVFVGLLCVMGFLAASCLGFLPLGGWRQVATYSGTGTQTTPTYLIRGDRYRVTIKTWTSEGGKDQTYDYSIDNPTGSGGGDSGHNESVGGTLTILRGNGRPISSFHYNSDPDDRDDQHIKVSKQPVTPTQYQITITAPPTVKWQVSVQESKPK